MHDSFATCPAAAAGVSTGRLRALGKTLLIAGAFCFSPCAPAKAPLPAKAASPPPPIGDLANEPMVDVAKMDDTIVVELRYATANNITGQPIYPPGTRCLVRRATAAKLEHAQQMLQPYQLRLKVWDAYRPIYAQQALWDHAQKIGYVADPAKGRSLHTWGVAVDVTLVDLKGKPVPMPTDFDDFTPAAGNAYTGVDPAVSANFRILKHVMKASGFFGSHVEWWHYMDTDWKRYGAVIDAGNVTKPPPRPPFDFWAWLKRVLQ